MSIEKIRASSDDDIRNLHAQGMSKAKMIDALGGNSKDPRIRKILRDRLSTLGLTQGERSADRRTWIKEDLVQAVTDSLCWSDVVRKLGLTIHGSNNATARRYCDQYGIDYSHFDRKLASLANRGLSDSDQLAKLDRSTMVNRSTIKRIVLKYNLVPYICLECSNEGRWQNKPLSLQLDHINGDPCDNRVENLRFLCPNCHSQTPTFVAKKQTLVNRT